MNLFVHTFNTIRRNAEFAFHVHGRQTPAKTHQQILDITTYLQNELARSAIHQNLSKDCQIENATGVEDTLDSSIDLAVRLIRMLNIGELRNAFSGRQRLIWLEASLQEFVRDISPDKISLSYNGIRLGTTFMACNLDYVTCSRVELTTNPADHLCLR
jgi:hypothetical protein